MGGPSLAKRAVRRSTTDGTAPSRRSSMAHVGAKIDTGLGTRSGSPTATTRNSQIKQPQVTFANRDDNNLEKLMVDGSQTARGYASPNPQESMSQVPSGSLTARISGHGFGSRSVLMTPGASPVALFSPY